MEKIINYYEILGINFTEDQKLIKEAFDKNISSLNFEGLKFQKIQKAYEVLSNKDSKKHYDDLWDTHTYNPNVFDIIELEKLLREKNRLESNRKGHHESSVNATTDYYREKFNHETRPNRPKTVIKTFFLRIFFSSLTILVIVGIFFLIKFVF